MANILIVDRHPLVRGLMREELASEGHRVAMTGKPELIQEMIRCSRPDLVLLDLHMNGRDRWDLLDEMKRQMPRLPVIIVSAYNGYREDPRLELADGFVIKSFIFDELKRKIAAILRRKAAGMPLFLKPSTGGQGEYRGDPKKS